MARSISIGGRRHRITIQSQTVTTDEGGGNTVPWSNVATVYAEIKDISGNETEFGEQQRETLRQIISIRYRTNVTSANRIKYEYSWRGTSYTRYFNILAVRDRDNRRRFLDMLCEEGVPT